MNSFGYGLRSAWPAAVESVESVAGRFTSTLDALSEAQPCFNPWKIGDYKKRRMTSYADALTRIPELVRAGVYRDEAGKDPNGGYDVFAIAGAKNDSGSRLLAFQATAGSKWNLNETELSAGWNNCAPDPSIVTYPIFKSALDVLIANWPCAWANVYAFHFDYDNKSLAPGVAPFQYSRFHMPWISYVSPQFVHGLAPPKGIDIEHTSNGGLIMIVTRATFDPTDTLHMTRSRMLSETMIDRLGVNGQPPSV